MGGAGELILDTRSGMSDNQTNNNERWEQMSSTTEAGVVRRTGKKVGRFYVYEYTNITGRTFRWVGCRLERDVPLWYVWPVLDGVDADCCGEYFDANPLDRHYRPQPWFVNYMGSGMHA